MKSEKKTEFALYFAKTHIKRDKNYIGEIPAASIRVNVVTLDGESIRNPGIMYGGNGYADFEFTARMDSHLGVYGFDARFKDAYIVDRQRAQEMVKTFKAVERAINKLEYRPVTFGQYVTGIARGLGFKKLVYETEGGNGSYDSMRHSFHDLKYAADIIDGAANTELADLKALAPAESEVK